MQWDTLDLYHISRHVLKISYTAKLVKSYHNTHEFSILIGHKVFVISSDGIALTVVPAVSQTEEETLSHVAYIRAQ